MQFKKETDLEEKIEKKLKEKLKHKSKEDVGLTKRLAIVGLAWADTNANDILTAIASVVENSNEIKGIKIYKSNFGKTTPEPANRTEMKESYYAIIEFKTIECALETYNSCEALEFPTFDSFFTFKVVPENKIFEDLPTDEAKIEDIQILEKNKQIQKNLTNKKQKEVKEESEEIDDIKDDRFKEVNEDDDFFIDESHTAFKKKNKK